jgi:hypothetical protein
MNPQMGLRRKQKYNYRDYCREFLHKTG